MTIYMCLAKLSEIEKVFLISKIIIWNENLNDNKCNTVLLF